MNLCDLLLTYEMLTSPQNHAWTQLLQERGQLQGILEPARCLMESRSHWLQQECLFLTAGIGSQNWLTMKPSAGGVQAHPWEASQLFPPINKTEWSASRVLMATATWPPGVMAAGTHPAFASLTGCSGTGCLCWLAALPAVTMAQGSFCKTCFRHILSGSKHQGWP